MKIVTIVTNSGPAVKAEGWPRDDDGSMNPATHRHDDPGLPTHHDSTALVCDLCGEIIDGYMPEGRYRFANERPG